MSKITNFVKLFLLFLLPGQGKRHWKKIPSSTFQFWANQPENMEMNGYLTGLLQQYRPSSSILEIGCYTGQRLRAIGRVFPHLKLHGLEINPNATSHGNLEFYNSGYKNDIIYCGDINKLKKLTDQSYSVVLSWAVLMYVHPIQIRGVLKSLLSMTEEALIIIEPAAPSSFLRFLPARNQSFIHDYRTLLLKLSGVHDELLEIDVSNSIWKPKYGSGKTFILRKPNRY
jgi:SAM-dependent methyltransferase